MVFYGQLIGGVHLILTYISNDYLTTRNGIYYFQRRVPTDVRSHYKSYSIAFSLKTRIRKITSESITVHPYRHAIRDRLRAMQCPVDIVDAIGGSTAGSIGEKYGQVYKLDVLYEWMVKLVIQLRRGAHLSNKLAMKHHRSIILSN